MFDIAVNPLKRERCIAVIISSCLRYWLSLVTSITLMFCCHHCVSNSKQTTNDKPKEVKNEVKSSYPLPGVMCYDGWTKGCSLAWVTQLQNSILSLDYKLQLAYMKLESPLIADQPFGDEFIPKICIHHPSYHGGWP